jgi:hypothetical protein
VTPVANNSDSGETIQTAAGKAWTAEPTVISVFDTFFIPYFGGPALIARSINYPDYAKGGNGFVVRVTSPTGTTPNVSGCLTCLE